MEKASEHRVPLHFNSMDFKAATETIWSDALRKMVRSIEVDPTQDSNTYFLPSISPVDK